MLGEKINRQFIELVIPAVDPVPSHRRHLADEPSVTGQRYAYLPVS